MKPKKSKSKRGILDEYQREEIKELLKAKKSEREIATMYKCNIGEVYKIKAKMPYVDNGIIAVEPTEIKTATTTADIHKAENNVVNIDDLVVKNVESDIDDQERVETTKRKRISQEVKNAIMIDFRIGLKTEDIMAKYHISSSSAYRLKCQYKELLKNAVITNEKKNNNSETSLFDEKKLLKIQNDSFVKLGLVADRHNINPVTDYIFEEKFDGELMFDYAQQFKIAKSVIEKKIPFNNGKPIKGLMLYTTGLQAALVSVIKACEEMKIPLVVMHYNTEDQAYHPQNFSVDNTIIAKVPVVLSIYVKKVRLLQLYNCMPEDLIDAENILEIKECFYDAPSGSINRSVIATDSTIFINKDSAWSYFRLKAEEATPSKSVFLNIGSIENGKYYSSGKSIARIAN